MGPHIYRSYPPPPTTPIPVSVFAVESDIYGLIVDNLNYVKKQSTENSL